MTQGQVNAELVEAQSTVVVSASHAAGGQLLTVAAGAYDVTVRLPQLPIRAKWRIGTSGDWNDFEGGEGFTVAGADSARVYLAKGAAQSASASVSVTVRTIGNMVLGSTSLGVPVTASKTLTGVIEKIGGDRDALADRGVDQFSNTGGAIIVDWESAVIGTPVAGWTVEKDYTRTFGGKPSLKITATAGAADTLTCNITIPATFFGGAKRICWAVSSGDPYINGDATLPYQFWINYSAGATHRIRNYVHPAYVPDEWCDNGCLYDQDIDGSGHITGTTQWGKVATETTTSIMLVMQKRAGQAISLPSYIGPIFGDPIRDTRPILTIMMDGMYKGQWDYARPILRANNIRASLAILVPWLSNLGSDKMTMAQVRAMNKSFGHEYIGHTGTPGDYGWDSQVKYPDGQEYALIKADLEAIWSWMRSENATSGIGLTVIGFTAGMAISQTLTRRKNISQALLDAGVKAVRQTGNFYGSYYGCGGERNTFLNPSLLVTSAMPVATVTAAIDRLWLHGGWSGLSFHDVVLSGATGNNVNVANFKTIVEYAVAKGVRILPLSEAMSAINATKAPV